MDIKSVFSFLKKDLNQIEKDFNKYTKSEVPIATKISNYVISGGGKRVRPSLLILSARMCGCKDMQTVYKLGCAIEMLHTATLLHDDVIDNAKTRRGRESANILFDNKATILAGDFLNSQVLIILVSTNNLEVLDIYTKTTLGLVHGEIFQMLKERDVKITQDDYFYIIRNKTASLMATGAMTGAILAGKSDNEKKALQSFGLNMGMAFQIIDDALDYAADESKLGKNLFADLNEGKITLPLIHILENGSSADKKTVAKVIKSENHTDKDLKEIFNLIKKYDSINYTKGVAMDFVNKAVENLTIFPDCQEKEAMLTVANFVVNRGY